MSGGFKLERRFGRIVVLSWGPLPSGQRLHVGDIGCMTHGATTLLLDENGWLLWVGADSAAQVEALLHPLFPELQVHETHGATGASADFVLPQDAFALVVYVSSLLETTPCPSSP
jgi:hypothetical protein